MTNKHDLSQSELKDLLHYNPDTGVFTWNKSISRIKKGDIAGSININADGYKRIRIEIKRKKHQAHRLAWFYMYGRWPINQIDHIDGNPLNNRILNIRECSNSENQQNRSLNKNNNSGYFGVTFHKPTGKFQSQIRKNGKNKYLGRFDNPEEAHKAYVIAKAKLHTFNPDIPERTLLSQASVIGD